MDRIPKTPCAVPDRESLMAEKAAEGTQGTVRLRISAAYLPAIKRATRLSLRSRCAPHQFVFVVHGRVDRRMSQWSVPAASAAQPETKMLP